MADRPPRTPAAHRPGDTAPAHPPKLYALADAILAGRGPDGSPAWQTAATLRAAAAAPPP